MADRHHTPEYRAAKRYYRDVIAEGRGWCAQPICVMDSRFIPPGTPSDQWHVVHDDSGQVILGAGHGLCNLHEAGKKRHRLTGKSPSAWVTGRMSPPGGRFPTRACEMCGAPYTPSYKSQRTCGRACGAELRRLNAPIAQPKPRPSKARPSHPCPECGQAIPARRRYCGPCAEEVNRARARNRYRERVGIPLDAPDQRRAASYGDTA